MAPLRFLQVSDLRYGAVPALPELDVDARVRRLLVEDQRRMLDRIVSLAAEHRADVVLVAGDLLDDAHATPEHADQLVRALASLSPRPVLMSPGDLDPPHPASYLSPEVLELMGKGALPTNLTVFRATAPTMALVAGIAVTGWAIPGRGVAGADAPVERPAGPRSALASLPKPPAGTRHHVLLAHQGAAVLPVVPTPQQLTVAGITYLALGGHEATSLERDIDGHVRVARAGHPFPNRMSATHGGVLLGEIDERGGVAVEVADSGARRIHVVPCDVTGVDPGELVAHLRLTLKSRGVREQDLALVKLSGIWRSARLPQLSRRALEPACTHLKLDPTDLVLALQNGPTVRDLHRAGLVPRSGEPRGPVQLEALRLVDAAWEGGEVIPSGENPSDPV